MDAVKIRRYQERLLRRRRDILSTLERLKQEGRKSSGERFFDWLDQARDESDRLLRERLGHAYELELQRIETALRRALGGRYGVCAGCRQPIGERRLEIFPAAEFCSECQGMREEFERV